MTVPTVSVIIDFSTGPALISPFQLDLGVLGTDQLADTLSISVDISNRVDRINTTRGRNITADVFQAGTATVRILDENGDFNPQNPSGPYYGLLSPMRKVQISATYTYTSPVTYPIFMGYITSYSHVIPNKSLGELGYTTLNLVDGFQLLNMASVTTVIGSGAEAGRTVFERFDAILNTVGWPASMRVSHSATPYTFIQADPGTTRTALRALQTVAASCGGALFMSPSGVVTFLDNGEVAKDSADTFSLTDADPIYTYQDPVWKNDDLLIFNEANITRVGGTIQTAQNAASIAQYFKHSYNASDLLMQSDAVALELALAFVGAHQAGGVRCDSVTLDFYNPDYVYLTYLVFASDFFQSWQIRTTQPGGTYLQTTEELSGTSHSITPSSWKATLNFRPKSAQIFVLGSTTLGVLDTAGFGYMGG